MKHTREEHSVFQIELLSELFDETYFELFSIFISSFSDLDDTYTCDACTDNHLCYVCIVSANEVCDIPTT